MILFNSAIGFIMAGGALALFGAARNGILLVGIGILLGTMFWVFIEHTFIYSPGYLVALGCFYAWWSDDDSKRKRRKAKKWIGEKSKAALSALVRNLKPSPVPVRRPVPAPSPV